MDFNIKDVPPSLTDNLVRLFNEVTTIDVTPEVLGSGEVTGTVPGGTQPVRLVYKRVDLSDIFKGTDTYVREHYVTNVNGLPDFYELSVWLFKKYGFSLRLDEGTYYLLEECEEGFVLRATPDNPWITGEVEFKWLPKLSEVLFSNAIDFGFNEPEYPTDWISVMDKSTPHTKQGWQTFSINKGIHKTSSSVNENRLPLDLKGSGVWVELTLELEKNFPVDGLVISLGTGTDNGPELSITDKWIKYVGLFKEHDFTKKTRVAFYYSMSKGAVSVYIDGNVLYGSLSASRVEPKPLDHLYISDLSESTYSVYGKATIHSVGIHEEP